MNFALGWLLVCVALAAFWSVSRWRQRLRQDDDYKRHLRSRLAKRAP